MVNVENCDITTLLEISDNDGVAEIGFEREDTSDSGRKVFGVDPIGAANCASNRRSRVSSSSSYADVDLALFLPISCSMRKGKRRNEE